MRRSISASMAFLAFISVAQAGPQGRGKGKNGNKGQSQTISTSNPSPNGSVFGKDEARIIREWFSVKSNLQGLPPGLAKKEQLPPGLQKQLIRNGTLPPGLQKKIQPLPQQLEIRLPQLPDGRRRIAIAGNIILLDQRTSAILDVIQAVF